MVQIIHSHQTFDPSHFENGFSLTSLISSLFHFDDDISKYEHVESDSSSSNTNDDKNATNTTSSDEDRTESSHQHTTIDPSPQDSSDKSNSHTTPSNQSEVLTENNQSIDRLSHHLNIVTVITIIQLMILA